MAAFLITLTLLLGQSGDIISDVISLLYLRGHKHTLQISAEINNT